MKKTKKGFTIVELIIVIAVIAVLTAILVPTFIHLTKKANEAADHSLVTNLNKALAMREAEEGDKGKNNTMYDCVVDLKKEGYGLTQLATRSDEDLVWSLKANRFFLSSEYDAEKHGEKYNCWHIYDKMPTEQTWAIYPNEEKWTEPIVEDVVVSFDAGKANIEDVEYVGDTKDVVTLRTNGGSLTVNASNDNVNWYGAASLEIEAVKDKSFHAYGRPTGEIEISSGHYIVESNYESNFLIKGNGVSITTTSDDDVLVIKNAGVSSYTVNGITYTDSAVVSGETKKASIDDSKAILNGNTYAAYDSFADAISALADGEKLVLLKDITIIDNSPTPVKDNNNSAVTFRDKSFSLNGNGKKITSDGKASGAYTTHDLFNLEQSDTAQKISMNFYNMNIVSTHYQDVFLLNSDLNYDFQLNISDSTITCDGETVYSNGPRAIAVLNDCVLKHEGQYAPGKDDRYYSALIVGYGGFINAYNCKVKSFGNGATTFPSGGVVNLFETDIDIEAVEGASASGYALRCTMEPNKYEGLYVIRGAEINVHGGSISGEFSLKDTSTAYDAKISLFEGRFTNDPTAYVVDGKSLTRNSAGIWIVE